ncbi:hypothetical protein [Subtercola frigoramans]|uniref:Antitoxin Xre/MbcA/ParS-like toxin-binding domain-containing protein n=1 Tax=Subtercola frigoramans TaxID=120298 RepID=A0ABS2L187_9MICO|nr:hypothetical protein [Subtercola frigoramans]MBM7470846.1 hypothetical protein [Subtercola frigoramans]
MKRKSPRVGYSLAAPPVHLAGMTAAPSSAEEPADGNTGPFVDQRIADLFESLQKGFTGLGASATATLVEDIVHARQGISALAPALVTLPGTTSPAVARALQATENVWRDIEVEFGLLSSTEVAEMLSSRAANRALASQLRVGGRLLGVRRLNAFLYPGFQFDSSSRRIKPVISPLVELARENSWAEEEVVLWLCSPSGYLRGDRPVDHLDSVEQLLAVARRASTVEW